MRNKGCGKKVAEQRLRSYKENGKVKTKVAEFDEKTLLAVGLLGGAVVDLEYVVSGSRRGSETARGVRLMQKSLNAREAV